MAPATHQMEEFHAALTALIADSDMDVQDAIQGIQERVESVLEVARGSLRTTLIGRRRNRICTPGTWRHKEM